jgi:hypothetical protein
MADHSLPNIPSTSGFSVELYEPILEAFEAAGADQGIAYVSVPITSGRLELDLLLELNCSREDLRTRYRERWLNDVVYPNEQRAKLAVSQARGTFHDLLIVDPSRLHVPDWGQDTFDKLWRTLIERYARRLVLSPGWEFSRGARVEAALAVELRLEISDPLGRPLDLTDLRAIDEAARSALVAAGWTDRQVADLLPELTTAQQTIRDRNFDDPLAAAAEAFAWLAGERRYQLAKFGTTLDDEHTREGIGTESWWWQQITNYFHRASLLGLDNPLGRQAIAKFTATACGLFESVIREYGAPPPPGVPSGELGSTD